MERRLFLTSRSSNPDALLTLEVFLGGFRGQKVAYIPTANNGETHYGYWKTDNTFKLFSSLNLDLKVFQLEEEKDNPHLEDDISKCSAIYMAGGMPGYLMYWINRLNLKSSIVRLLDAGLVYIGSSAGAMVAGPSLELCDYKESERGASNIPSLNLVDFHIFPHYNDELYESIKSFYKGKKLYLLKDGESITVEGDSINVVGKPRMIGTHL